MNEDRPTPSMWEALRLASVMLVMVLLFVGGILFLSYMKMQIDVHVDQLSKVPYRPKIEQVEMEMRDLKLELNKLRDSIKKAP